MILKISRVLDKHQKSRSAILLIMIIIGAFFEMLGVSAVLPLVSAVTNPEIIKNNRKYIAIYDFLGMNSYKEFILVMAIGLVILYVIKNIYLILLNMAQNHFVTNNRMRLTTRMMNCYMKQDYFFHVNHNVSELQRNVDGDVDKFLYVISNMLELITEGLVCLLLIIFLMITDIRTTLLLAFLMAFFLLLFLKVIRKRIRILGELTRDLSEKKTRVFLESFGGIKEIKALSVEDYFVSRYNEIQSKYALALQKQLTISYIPKPTMESLCICSLLTYMVVRIIIGDDVNRFIPVMSVFAVAAIRMLPSFNRISGNLSSIMFCKPSVDALYNDLKEMEVLEKALKERDNSKLEIPSGDIIVSNIRYAYPSKPDCWILDNVSFVIPRNKSIAFIGPSGGGKTTTADIVMGLLKPQQGTVSVGGVNILEHEKEWHDHIGYIPQNIFLTDDTVRANVAFGLKEDEIDDGKVWEALENAQMADYFRHQPYGINTVIGERGVMLSGEQRQRIGIARAIYYDPEIIVLDEATSALDNRTENAVMDAIYSLAGRKTMIIIAHRLSTIEGCDIVYEIKNGKVTTKRTEVPI